MEEKDLPLEFGFYILYSEKNANEEKLRLQLISLIKEIPQNSWDRSPTFNRNIKNFNLDYYQLIEVLKKPEKILRCQRVGLDSSTALYDLAFEHPVDKDWCLSVRIAINIEDKVLVLLNGYKVKRGRIRI